MAKKKTKKRAKLGQGYIWFSPRDDDGPMFKRVTLYQEMHGHGKAVELETHGLGAWKKVKLYAEWVS